MHIRYPAALTLTLALLASHPAEPAGRHRSPRPAAGALPAARDLFSQRALRRAKTILQLKLLEMRSEHLERVRHAIEQRLPVDELLKT